MINISPKTILFLSISSAVFLPACTTSLASRTPVDIASNSWQYLDPVSGKSEIWGPSVNALGGRQSAINAVAHLRTAERYTDEQGRVLKDGAYLDLLINYTTATPNPEDARIFDEVSWPGGSVASLVDFGQTIVDCREDVRETYIPNNYGYYGYGSGYGRYGRHEGYRRGYGGRHDGRYGRRRGHSGGYGGYSGGSHGSHGGHTPDTDIDTPDKPRTQGRPHKPRGAKPHSGNSPRNSSRNSGNTGGRAPLPMDGPNAEPYRGANGRMVKPNDARTSRGRSPRSLSRSSPTPRSAPRPVQNYTPPPKPQSTYTPPPKPRPSSRSHIERPVKSKKTNGKLSIRKERNYYPRDGYYESGRTIVNVSYSCMREENLRIYVPAERLTRAAETGLVLYVRPRIGREAVIDLPANYVTGFKLASSEQGRGLAQRIANLPPRSVIEAGQAVDAPAPSTEPSANTPIIYGDP